MQVVASCTRFGSLFALAILCASCSSSTAPTEAQRASGGSTAQGGASSEGGSAPAGTAGLAGGAAPVEPHDCSDGLVKCAAHATCIPNGLQYDCVCDDGYTGDGVSSCSMPVQTPVCGDKICQASETCTTCSADCGACPKITCAACTTSCATGTCSVRPCDGVQGCYAAANSECDVIAGKECPAVPLFAPCTADADCGSGNSCFNNHCTPPACSSPIGGVPCPKLTWPGVSVACVGLSCGPESCSDTASLCQLKCVAGAQCPYGMTCTAGACE